MSETFNLDIHKQLVKIPSGFYKGVISEYEVKHFQNSVGVIFTVNVMNECYPAKVTVFVNNKSTQLGIILSLIGYQLPFNGTFDPKDALNKEVFIRIQEGKGYKGYDKHEFLYEFQYNSGHGIQAQKYEENKKSEPSKEFKKMDKPQEDNSPTEPIEVPKDFVDKNGYKCTYIAPHPSTFYEYAVSKDENGIKYYVLVNAKDTDTDTDTDIPF